MFSFNLEKVPKDISQPLIGSLKVDKIKAGPYSQDEILQTPVTLVILATPGILTILYDLIKQDAYIINSTDKQRL